MRAHVFALPTSIAVKKLICCFAIPYENSNEFLYQFTLASPCYEGETVTGSAPLSADFWQSPDSASELVSVPRRQPEIYYPPLKLLVEIERKLAVVFLRQASL